MTAYDATSLATKFHIVLGQNFYALSSDEVCRVLSAADSWKYRKPKNANGSRGRYFYELLNRSAKISRAE